MRRVTGIGGIFFKAKDAASLQAWYKRHVGIDVQVWGGASFGWTDGEGEAVAGTTAWLIIRSKVITLLRALRPSWSTTVWKTSMPWSRS